MTSQNNSRSPAIKAYYDELRLSAGLKSKDVAEALGITKVSMSNLSHRLDQMSGEQISAIAKLLGVDPGQFLNKLNELRKTESN